MATHIGIIGDGNDGKCAGAIANRCPVHRTLTSEIDIRTRLV